MAFFDGGSWAGCAEGAPDLGDRLAVVAEGGGCIGGWWMMGVDPGREGRWHEHVVETHWCVVL